VHILHIIGLSAASALK